MEYQLPGGGYNVVTDTISAQTPGGGFLPGPLRILKVQVHDNALGEFAVNGVVFQSPSVGNICGARIGEFTNFAFGSATENGFAVLRVPLSNFGGESLTPTDTPVVLVRNQTSTTGIIPASVVDE